jgi:hypothetical protein
MRSSFHDFDDVRKNTIIYGVKKYVKKLRF